MTTRHQGPEPHPRVPGWDAALEPAEPAAALGYRMPAEWEPLARLWLTPPHNPETWPGCLDRAQAQFEAFERALSRYATVARVPEVGGGVATNDSWVRDYGPVFVVRDHRPTPDVAAPAPDPAPLAAHDFRFNGWGGKYERRDLDDVVPQRIAQSRGLPLWVHDTVLEGGSIEVDGRGTVMTTEQCLLNPNRNPHLDRAAIESILHGALGTTHVIWLPGGIVGDDTDGHVDDIARFVGPGVVVAVTAPADHPDHAVLSRNLDRLRGARDATGAKLEVVGLPAPDPIAYDYPADRFGPGGRQFVPASHANFLIANGAVLMPAFGGASDEVAARTLERVMPGFEVVPLRADAVVVGLGAWHCLSMQEPAARGAGRRSSSLKRWGT